jgi:antitoxin component of RelBE/YafQ-DinJ toxin-antitoxin module
MKTTTISLRVPVDFKSELQSICNNKGITMSEYCLAKLTPNSQIPPIKANVLNTITEGEVLNNDELQLPVELSKVLGATGGLIVGIIVYNALKTNLAKHNPEWSDEKIQAIAITSGLASALLGGIGITKLSKSLGIK